MVYRIRKFRHMMPQKRERFVDYGDIIYEVNGHVARITINRPEKRNAFRGLTLDELTDAFRSGLPRATGKSA